MTLYSQDNAQWVGIRSIGCYLPDQVMTSHDMAQLSDIPPSVFADKIGIMQKPIAGADEHPSEMGVKTAVDALGKAGIAASEIDLIVYCGAGDYDYRFWSPACLSTFVMADGAAAVVLEKGGKTNRILAYHGMTDGSLADFLKIPAGGTRVPQHADRCSHLLNVDNPEELERIFSELYLKNYQLVVKASLEKSMGWTMCIFC